LELDHPEIYSSRKLFWDASVKPSPTRASLKKLIETLENKAQNCLTGAEQKNGSLPQAGNTRTRKMPGKRIRARQKGFHE
jgi:hypothetical protein